MVALCTSGDLANLLQVAISNAAAPDAAIAEASAAIQNYTHQTLVAVANETVTLTAPPGRALLLLPELPVTAVASVAEDGSLLVVGDDYRWSAEGILERVGRFWNSGFQKVVAVYSHGYATIPDTIKYVCARAAARRYQAGLKAAGQGGVPGIQSQAIPDYTVAYGPDTGAGGYGTLGVTAPPILLPSEKEALYPYRMKP